MLEAGQEVLITIKRIGINGEGIGYYKRMAVFVFGVIPPEEVVVKIDTVHNTYAEATAVRIKKRAYYRAQPFCKHYETCGGCQFQHIAYEEQLRLKEDMLKQSFERYVPGGTKIVFKTIRESVDTRAYRHKAQMPVRNSTSGLRAGLYRDNSRDIVDIDMCPVHTEAINDAVKNILILCDKHDVSAVDLKAGRGLMRTIVVRESAACGALHVTLVVTLFNRILKALADDIAQIPHVVGVAISKNHDLNHHEIFGPSYEVLSGDETLSERLGNTEFMLHPPSFFQLNPALYERLVDYVKTLLNPKTDKTLLDLYTGSGAMALSLAKDFEAVTGIDNDTASIASARRNKTLNAAGNVTFLLGDAARFAHAKISKGSPFDVIICDPPRTGLDDALMRWLIQRPVKKLIYVSCNPSTLAKNVNVLKKAYDVVSVKPFDMFPHTSHIESVTLLSLKTP